MLAVGLICVATVAWSRFSTLSENFGNYDVAGIVYNADLILNGGIPYRDTFEVKTPFLFYLYALVFRIFGASLIYIRLIWGTWLLVSCALIFGICRRLFDLDPREQRGVSFYREISAGTAALLMAVYGTMFDINYASWLVLPLSLSVYSYIRAKTDHRVFWLLLCGVAASIAFLVKNPGGFIVLLYLGLEAHDAVKIHQRRACRRAIWNLVTIAGGCVLGFLPLIAHFGFNSALGPLVRGLFPGWFLKGVLSAKSTSSEGYLVIQNIPRGLVQIYRMFTLPAVLAVIVIFFMLVWKSFLGYYGKIAFFWFGLSFFSVLITGGRFYPHHAILYVPSLVILAVHPGVLVRISDASRMRLKKGSRAVLAVGVGALLIGILTAYKNIWNDERSRYDWPAPIGEPEPQRLIGEYIKANTTPEDTIIAWGWFAWPIYHWAQRRAPSPIYKETGVLTDVNTNTEWTLSRPIHFVPGPLSDQYVKDVKAKRPAFVIISQWFPFISRNEPLLEFKELLAYLESRYVVLADMKGFRILRRKDHEVRTSWE